jgi:hypothetical protein
MRQYPSGALLSRFAVEWAVYSTHLYRSADTRNEQNLTGVDRTRLVLNTPLYSARSLTPDTAYGALNEAEYDF